MKNLLSNYSESHNAFKKGLENMPYIDWLGKKSGI